MLKPNLGFRNGFLTLLFVSLSLGVPAASADAGDKDKDNDARRVSVNCDRGRSLQRAIGKKKAGVPLVIVVRGTCRENIMIMRPKISIVGHGGGAAIVGDGSAPAVLVDGATNVRLENLTVTGGVEGLLVRRGAAVQIHDFSANQNAADGIAGQGSSALTASGAIGCSHNGQDGIDIDRGSTLNTDFGAPADFICNGNVGDGIQVNVHGSFQQFFGSITASENGRGISVNDSGMFFSFQSPITVSDNQGRGFQLLFGGVARILGASGHLRATGNGDVGLSLFNGGRLDIGAGATADVLDNAGFAGVQVESNSSLSVQNGSALNVENSGGDGILVTSSSSLFVGDSNVVSSGNGRNGLGVSQSSSAMFINLNGTASFTSQGNASFGLVAFHGGRVRFDGANASIAGNAGFAALIVALSSSLHTTNGSVMDVSGGAVLDALLDGNGSIFVNNGAVMNIAAAVDLIGSSTFIAQFAAVNVGGLVNIQEASVRRGW